MKASRAATARFGFWAAVAALASARILLQASLPVFARPFSRDDDLLLVSYARHWIAGNAWGPYFVKDMGTALEKLPGFSVFLGIGNGLGIPFSLWFGLAWTSACLLALAAVRPIVRNRLAAVAAFAWMLFCPITLDVTSQRLYCLGLVAPVALLAAACSTGLVLGRGGTFFRRAAWALGLSFATGFYGILRADFQWMLLLAAGCAVLSFRPPDVRNGPKRFWAEVLGEAFLLVLPFLSFVSARECLRTFNERRYGVAVTNDFTETGFAETCLALMRIRPESESPMCYVSHETFRKAFRESPTLAELEPTIERAYVRNPCPERMPDGELEREFYAWNVRLAAVGWYRDGAQTADRLFRQCAAEIRGAVESGRLRSRDALILSPFTGPVDAPRFARILVHSAKNGFGAVLGRKRLQAQIADVERGNQFGMLEEVSKERIPFRGCDDEHVRVHGFFFAADASAVPKLRLRDKNGKSFSPRVGFREYPAAAGDPARAGRRPYADFAVTSGMMDVPSCELSVSLGGKTVWRGPVAAAAGIKTPELEAEALVEEKHPDGPLRFPPARRSVSVANRILAVSRILCPVLFFALAFHAVRGIRLLFSKKRLWEHGRLWLFETGLVLVAWAVLFICSANFFEKLPSGFPTYYAVGAYVLLDFFAVVALGSVECFPCGRRSRSSSAFRGEASADAEGAPDGR